MDLQVPSFPFLFSFFLFVFMVIKIDNKRTETSSSVSKLPPGPWKLSFMGNLHQLFGPLPHHVLRDLAKKHGPFMYLRIGQIHTIIVSSPEYAKEVMRTHDVIFASRPRIPSLRIMTYDYTDIAFAPYGEYWRQLRKICGEELLSTARVQSFRPIREEEFFNLIEWIASNIGSAINLTEKIRASTFRITSWAAFGKKSRDYEDFVSVVIEAMEISTGLDLADLLPSLSILGHFTRTRPKLKILKRRVAKLIETIIKEHKENESEKNGESWRDEDLADVLLKYYNNGDLGFSLTSDNINAVIWVRLLH